MRHLALALALALVAASVAAAQDKVFRAGAFAQDVTPTKFPISVNGNMNDVQATKVHDRLHARCLVLDDGRTKLAIVIVDSCMIPREIFDTAKRLAYEATGIPPERVLMAATHAHSCPTVGGVFQSEPDADYVKLLPTLIAKGVKRAHDQRVPAKIGWAVEREPTQVFNRRWKRTKELIPPDPFGGTRDLVQMNPGYRAPGLIEQAGPVDPDVSVLSVQSREGRPLALLANYSLHYVGAPAISADYFGAFAERVGQLLKVGTSEPAFVGIMSNGTSGDANNVVFAGAAPGPREPFQQARFVADRVAQVAVRAYAKIEHRDWVSLAMAEEEIELGVRLPSADDVKRAEEILKDAPSPLKGLAQLYARETRLLAKYPKTVKARLQAVRIGDLGIVSSPCETFAESGLAIKKRSPLKPTFTIELANGYNGYLPPPEQHELGGYETWRARSSYLQVDAEPKIVATLVRLLDVAAKQR